MTNEKPNQDDRQRDDPASGEDEHTVPFAIITDAWVEEGDRDGQYHVYTTIGGMVSYNKRRKALLYDKERAERMADRTVGQELGPRFMIP